MPVLVEWLPPRRKLGYRNRLIVRQAFCIIGRLARRLSAIKCLSAKVGIKLLQPSG